MCVCVCVCVCCVEKVGLWWVGVVGGCMVGGCGMYVCALIVARERVWRSCSDCLLSRAQLHALMMSCLTPLIQNKWPIPQPSGNELLGADARVAFPYSSHAGCVNTTSIVLPLSYLVKREALS